MPSHSHTVNATNNDADKPGPGNKFLAADLDGFAKYNDGPHNKTMNSEMIANTGGGQQVDKRSPYLAMRWCVCLVGTFPSRN